MLAELPCAKWAWLLAVFFALGLTGCQTSAPPASSFSGEPLAASPTSTAAPAPPPSRTAEPTPFPSPTLQDASTPTPSAVPTATSTPAPVFYEPAGCWQPPDDYTRVEVNGNTLNARTYAMLQQAAVLYAGEIDVAGNAILQGGSSDSGQGLVEAGPGGGAVDISVSIPKTQVVLYTEIEPLIRALRTVGFAAWLRGDDTVGPESKVYVHAVPIGDRELSPAAQEQISGLAGYLRGFDGLPAPGGNPGLDRHGGPLICRWMLDIGITDLRTPTPVPTPELPWQERLRQSAASYLAPFPEDAEKMARSLNFLDGKQESAQNICGPLSGAILRDAGLLPNQAGPVQDLKSYWLARPKENGRPWSLFSERDYEVFRYDTPLAEFDFTAWPLQPGDFLYTYAIAKGFEHMFVVTEVDAEGRAYTVTNQYQAWANRLWGSMLIQRYMLYDPHTPGAGIIYNEWSNRELGLTGHYGFEVLRKRGRTAGSLFVYTVRPGDTLPYLVSRYGTTPESLQQANPDADLANLQVGSPLTIPIPSYTPPEAAP